MERFKGIGEWFMSFQGGKNSWRQDLKKKEIYLTMSKAAFFLCITSFLFYRSLWAVLILLPLAYGYYCLMIREILSEKAQEFRNQFREAIISLSGQLAVGYSVENAWKETARDMSMIYSKEDRIMKELAMINRQLRLQMPVEQVMLEFARRAELDDVQSFVTVFVAVKRNGGDMLRIIQDTVNQISDKVEVKREINTILASKRYEFRVLTVIPFGIIAYMSISFPEFMNALYGNILGIGVMTICLGAYIAAYCLGMKIVNIEL